MWIAAYKWHNYTNQFSVVSQLAQCLCVLTKKSSLVPPCRRRQQCSGGFRDCRDSCPCGKTVGPGGHNCRLYFKMGLFNSHYLITTWRCTPAPRPASKHQPTSFQSNYNDGLLGGQDKARREKKLYISSVLRVSCRLTAPKQARVSTDPILAVNPYLGVFSCVCIQIFLKSAPSAVMEAAQIALFSMARESRARAISPLQERFTQVPVWS